MHLPLYKTPQKIHLHTFFSHHSKPRKKKRLNPDLKMEEKSNTINYAPFEDLIILCIDRSG
jgi:hypothetical protein